MVMLGLRMLAYSRGAAPVGDIRVECSRVGDRSKVVELPYWDEEMDAAGAVGRAALAD